jgi:uncharacterized protein
MWHPADYPHASAASQPQGAVGRRYAEFFDSILTGLYHSTIMAVARGGLPESIDPVRLADEGRRLEGTIPVVRLPQLAAMCVSGCESGDGSAHVIASFERTVEGSRLLHLQLEAQGCFVCARCLEPVTVVWREKKLFVIARAAEADQVADDADILVADGPLRFYEFIEEALLLSVPMIPAHEECSRPVMPV